MTGCLSKGDTAGSYTLADETTGKKTTVTGTADLEKHSGNHKVTLMGSMSGHSFNATSLKHVSETCTAGQ